MLPPSQGSSFNSLPKEIKQLILHSYFSDVCVVYSPIEQEQASEVPRTSLGPFYGLDTGELQTSRTETNITHAVQRLSLVNHEMKDITRLVMDEFVRLRHAQLQAIQKMLPQLVSTWMEKQILVDSYNFEEILRRHRSKDYDSWKPVTRA